MKQLFFSMLLCLVSSPLLLAQSSENPFTLKLKKPTLDQLDDLELIREVDRLNQVNETAAGLVKLDSLVSHYYEGNDVFIGEVTRYTYDDRGNTLVEELLFYDEDSMTIYPEYKTSRTFNQNNQLTSLVQEIYDAANQNYQILANTEYLYQNDNLLDSTVTSSYNFGTMMLEFSSSAKYSYNGNDQLTLTSQYFWSNNDWLLSNNTTFEYTGDLLTESIISFYNPSTSMFTPSDRTQYTHDGQRVASQTNSRWDAYTQDWMFTYQINYTYDGNGNILSQTGIDYDDVLMMWVPDERQESTYNNDNKVVSSIYSEWDNMNSEWVGVERETYTYVNGNVEIYLQEEYDADNNIWLNDNRSLVSVDHSINVADIIAGGSLTYEIFSFFTNAPDTLFNENYDDSEMRFIEEDFTVFYYSPYSGTVNTTILLPTEPQLKLMPNPATSTVQLHLEGQSTYDLNVYDLTGKLVHSQQISNCQLLSTNTWQAGIYIMEVVGSNNQHLKAKLVKM